MFGYMWWCETSFDITGLFRFDRSTGQLMWTILCEVWIIPCDFLDDNSSHRIWIRMKCEPALDRSIKNNLFCLTPDTFNCARYWYSIDYKNLRLNTTSIFGKKIKITITIQNSTLFIVVFYVLFCLCYFISFHSFVIICYLIFFSLHLSIILFYFISFICYFICIVLCLFISTYLVFFIYLAKPNSVQSPKIMTSSCRHLFIFFLI